MEVFRRIDRGTLNAAVGSAADKSCSAAAQNCCAENKVDCRRDCSKCGSECMDERYSANRTSADNDGAMMRKLVAKAVQV